MSNWRTMRPRLAPMAERTANSCWRAVARASSRMDTLPQPINNSKATAPKSSQSVPPSCLDEILVQTHHVYTELLGGKVLRGLLGELLDQRLQRRVGLRMGHAGLESNSDIVTRVGSCVIFWGT